MKTTDDELNIAVARLCGWTESHTREAYIGDVLIIQVWKDSTGFKTPNLPNYTTDLNVMAKVEATLTTEERAAYSHELYFTSEGPEYLLSGDSGWNGCSHEINWREAWFLATATAMNRAKAFVAVKGAKK